MATRTARPVPQHQESVWYFGPTSRVAARMHTSELLLVRCASVKLRPPSEMTRLPHWIQDLPVSPEISSQMLSPSCASDRRAHAYWTPLMLPCLS